MSKKAPLKKLRKRIVKTFSGLIMVIMAIVMITVTLILINEISRGFRTTLSQQAHHAVKNIEHRIAYIQGNVKNFSNNHFIINSIVHPQGREDYLTKMMEDFGKLDNISSVSLVNYSGQLIHSNKASPPNYSKLLYLRPVLEMGRSTMILSKNYKSIFIIEPINHYDTPIGAIITEVDLVDIISYLLPDDRNYYYKVFCNSKLSHTHNHDDKKKYIVANTHTSEDNERGGNLPHIDIEIGVGRLLYIAPIRTVILELLFLSGIIIIITTFFALKTGNNIAKPILEMVKKTSSSEINPKISYSPVGTNDELEILAEALDFREKQLLEYRENLEERVNERTNELQLINKKLENYSYTISHDLKEPVRSIRSFSEFLLEDYGDSFDKTAKDYFGRIINASVKMVLMIDDLLILSRVGREDVEFKMTDIEDIIKEVKDTLQLKTDEHNADIEVDPMPNLKVQQTWIKAIFQNLLSNSIKYSDKETTNIKISHQKIYGYHEFTIRDNGIGIPKDQFEKIFKLFRKAHQIKEIEGSGAGLAIVSSVVSEHGGKVWVEWSEVGRGTIIKFTIKDR